MLISATTNCSNIENFIQQLCIGNEIYKCFNKLCIFNEFELDISDRNKIISYVFYSDKNDKKFIKEICIQLQADNQENQIQKYSYQFRNRIDLFNTLYTKNNLQNYDIDSLYYTVDNFLSNKNITSYTTLVQKNLEIAYKNYNGKLNNTEQIVGFFYKLNNYINNKTDKIEFIEYNNGIEKIIKKVFENIQKLINQKFYNNNIAKILCINLSSILQITILFFVKIIEKFLKFLYLLVEIIINTGAIIFISMKNIVLPYFYNLIIAYINYQLENILKK